MCNDSILEEEKLEVQSSVLNRMLAFRKSVGIVLLLSVRGSFEL
jgi:hypothetical protein